MAVKLGNGKWAVKEDKLLAYNDNSGRFFNKEFDFARGSSATYVAKDGLIKSAASDVPRIDFSDSTNGALLLEPQSTNVIPYSEDFSPSFWVKINNAFVSATKVISPDGTLNASQIIFDGTSLGRIQGSIGGLTQGAYYTVSVYARVSSGTQVVRFGSVTDFEYTLTTEWQRLTRTEAENDTVGYPRLRCDDAATIEIYAFQLEQNSYATSYIPSLSGSATTRLADVCNNSGSAQDFNSEEGVLYAEIAALADDGTSRTISINNTVSNRVFLQLRAASGQVLSGVVKNGVVQGTVMPYSISQTSNIKLAIKYNQNDFALWVNGIEVGTSSGNVFASDTLNNLSFDSGSGAEDFYGKVKDLQVFTTALTDEQLAALTTI